MMVKPKATWNYFSSVFLADEAQVNNGDIFAAAQLSFRAYESEWIKSVVALTETRPELRKGFVSSLAWLPDDIAHPWIKKFLESKDLNHKVCGIEACRQREENPGAYLRRLLERDDCIEHPPLFNSCLRVVGELKKEKLKPLLYRGLDVESEETRFWSLYALILLGEFDCAHELAPFVFEDNKYQQRAANVAFRVLPLESSKKLITDLIKESSRDSKEAMQKARIAILATGILADPQAVPWLLGQMKVPELAKISGEAFYTITGIDLEGNELTVDMPKTAEQKADEEIEAEDPSLPYDEHLPWPDVEKVWAFWHKKSQRRFSPGARYFMGEQINPGALKHIVAEGLQRQRHWAAFELALSQPGVFLRNTYGVVNPEK